MKVSYYTIAPPPALADVVRFYWVFEIEGINGLPYVYRSMADGCAELVFHYEGPFQEVVANGKLAPTLATLHAQSAIHRRFEVRQNFGIFGAYIYPSALPQLFGYSAAALSGEMPELPALLGSDGAVLEERILIAENNQERADILSGFLLKRMGKGKPGNVMAQHAVRLMLASNGQVSPTKLSDHLSISLRQLERQFKDYAGFSPKTFSRILRFQSAIKEFGNGSKRLVEIALDCGYYDQAHFNHDFNQFSGYAPGEYFFGRPEGVEYREV